MDSQSDKSDTRVHLFNCDRTFSLDIIAELLTAVSGSLPYTFSVEKHPFSLPQMKELSENVPTFEMDYAIFVVHAHESRLSINEENAGIGYAKLYKALLRATGNKVLLVIGGDDNYKNQNEEETEVLSRWAKHKILSQFTEDFLDGSTSFIFSWEKKHRPIHEEALLHFLLPGNEGKKFKPKPRPPKPETTLPEPEVQYGFEQRDEHEEKGRETGESTTIKPQQEEQKQAQEGKGRQEEPAETTAINRLESEDVTMESREEVEIAELTEAGSAPKQDGRHLKIHLFYGEVVETLQQEELQVPAYILEQLRSEWKDVKNAVVEIDENGQGGYSVVAKRTRWCAII